MASQLQQFISILSASDNPAKDAFATAKLAFDKVITLREERMSEHFVKYHIIGLPFDAVLHYFTCADGTIHDHPFAFTSYILKGGYKECVYNGVKGDYIDRLPGTTHRIEATGIHQICALLENECWTLILPEQWQQESGFYRIEEGVMQYRQWNESEWRVKI